jgi:hypothetical protein
MGMTQPQPRVYDHRIREQVVRTGNPDLFPELGVPRKTALSWIRRGVREVVTLDDEAWAPAYHVRIAKLERRIAMLSASCGSCSRCSVSRALSLKGHAFPMPRTSAVC